MNCVSIRKHITLWQCTLNSEYTCLALALKQPNGTKTYPNLKQLLFYAILWYLTFRLIAIEKETTVSLSFRISIVLHKSLRCIRVRYCLTKLIEIIDSTERP